MSDAKRSAGSRSSVALSLVTIVKDEEAVLARCLNSVKDLVDEMVIVDTGSTDGTKEIAAAYGDKVPGGVKILDFEWGDDFSAARNAGLDAASSRWVLQIDADEELLSGGDLLKDLLRDKFYLAYQVKMLNGWDDSGKDGAREINPESFLSLRLFRNVPNLRYRGVIHEHIGPEGTRIANSGLVVNHFGPLVRDRSDRPDRNIRLIRKALEADPRDPFYWSCLGNEYFLLKDFGQAYEAYLRAVPLADPELIYVIAMLRNMALCMFELGHKDEALRFLEDLQVRYQDYTDLFYLEGVLRLSQGRIREAVTLLDRCLKMGDPPALYHSWGGTGSVLPRGALRMIVEKAKTISEAGAKS